MTGTPIDTPCPIPRQDKDLTLDTPWGVFNHRVGCLIFRDGHILLQKSGSGYWFIPGGRVAFGESTTDTVQREMMEEFGQMPLRFEPAAIIENFFHIADKAFHEIGFYFRVDMPSGFEPPATDMHGKPQINDWHPIAALPDLDVKPNFFKTRLTELQSGFQHVVHVDR